MKYDPKDANKCFPAGTYKAALRAVVDSDENGPLMSKAGSKMEYLEYEIYGPNEQKMSLRNYITAETAAWQYKRISAAYGQEEAFKAGDFDPHNHIDEIIEVELEIKEYRGEDQNQIKKFLKTSAPAQPQGKTPVSKTEGRPIGPSETIDESDIPF